VYGVRDWARVRESFVQGKSKTAIAAQLGMSRNTVAELLSAPEPPSYRRLPKGSILDPYKDAVAAMLDQDPKAPATVVIERLRADGYPGGITILKDHLQKVRPHFMAARSYQRTTYLPGELGQFDWWHTGLLIPVGKGFRREAFGLVASLPHSASHAVTYTLGKTTADFCPAFAGCLERLGGCPQKAFFDNDTSIVASRRNGQAVFHPEVLALLGHYGIQPIALGPGRPESKGQAERTIHYLQTSFLPLRTFTRLEDLQQQSDEWNTEVAQPRHHRRVGARVADALRVEREFLRPLPSSRPDTDQHLEVRVAKDGFVRVGGADYSVPPGLASRRVQVRVSLAEVKVFHEHRQIACHRRSFVPADVVIAGAHARALRLAREAQGRIALSEPEVPVPDLTVYDRLAGVR
jgi:transposase